MRTIPILFEDKNIIALHKPSKMMVYERGDNFQKKKCLLSRLESSFRRPFYPIHWLDRACSGIVILAKNSTAAFELSKAWSAQSCVVKYNVLVKGHFREAGIFDFPLRDWTRSRQPAVTLYRPIVSCGPTTLMEVQTETECRHQIRRHFSRRCANVIGDKRYGQGKWNTFFKIRFGLNRIFMHLSSVKLNLRSYRKPLEIHCPVPEELSSVLQQLAIASPFMNTLDFQWSSAYFNAIANPYELM